jgi:acyl carrier protein
MEIREFIENLEELFDKKNSLKPESVFFDNVEWSSFNQLLLMNFINEKYGLKFKINDLNPFLTIENLFEKIETLAQKT